MIFIKYSYFTIFLARHIHISLKLLFLPLLLALNLLCNSEMTSYICRPLSLCSLWSYFTNFFHSTYSQSILLIKLKKKNWQLYNLFFFESLMNLVWVSSVCVFSSLLDWAGAIMWLISLGIIMTCIKGDASPLEV